MFGEAEREEKGFDFVDETENAKDCFFGNDCLKRWDEVRPDSEQPFLRLGLQSFAGGEAIATTTAFF